MQVSIDKTFQPVTITIETEGELKFFTDVLGSMTSTLEYHYGLGPTAHLFYDLERSVINRPPNFLTMELHK
jgi:hypothetical protein